MNKYNLYYDGEFVGTFTESELAKQFNITHEQVREIAKIAHHYGVPLIVDAAHGAHFPFS